MTREEEFNKELNKLLKKYRAKLTIQDEDYGNSFSPKIVVEFTSN